MLAFSGGGSLGTQLMDLFSACSSSFFVHIVGNSYLPQRRMKGLNLHPCPVGGLSCGLRWR